MNIRINLNMKDLEPVGCGSRPIEGKRNDCRGLWLSSVTSSSELVSKERNLCGAPGGRFSLIFFYYSPPPNKKTLFELNQIVFN